VGYLGNKYSYCEEKENHPPRTFDCAFVGYSPNNSSCRFLVLDLKVSEIYNNVIIESRDVVFFEAVFSVKNKLSRPICEDPFFYFVLKKRR